MSKADDTLIRLEDAISNIDYPGSDSPEWEHKAKLAARDLRALAPAPGAEVTEEWHVLGHPAWPGGIDFRTREQAERFYWKTPKLDGTREGMRIMHRTLIREPDYVPESGDPS